MDEPVAHWWPEMTDLEMLIIARMTRLRLHNATGGDPKSFMVRYGSPREYEEEKG